MQKRSDERMSEWMIERIQKKRMSERLIESIQGMFQKTNMFAPQTVHPLATIQKLFIARRRAHLHARNAS